MKQYLESITSREDIKHIIKGAAPYIIGFLIAFFLSLFIRKGLCITLIGGNSMYPTLKNGTFVKYDENTKDLKTGDIITFEKNDTKYVKRIIGIPGDTIHKTYSGGILHIEVIRKDVRIPYVSTETIQDFGILADNDIFLGEDEYFVLGDNINHSEDSRIFGPVYKDEITSKIISKIFHKKGESL